MNRTVRVSLFSALATLMLLLVGVVLLFVFIVHSERGAQFLVSQITQRAGLPVEIDRVSGRLSESVTLYRVSANTGKYRVELSQASLTLDLSTLVNRQLNIEDLHLSGLQLHIAEKTQDKVDDDAPFIMPRHIELPLDVMVQQARLDDASVWFGPTQTPLVIDQTTLRANWSGRALQIESLNVKSPAGQAQLTTTVHTEQPYRLSSTINVTVSGEQLGGMSDINATTVLNGSLESLTFQLTLAAPYSLDANGTLASLITDPVVDMSVRLNGTKLHQVAAQAPVMFIESDLSINGPPNALLVTGEVTVLPDGFPQTQFRLDSAVTPTRIEVKTLTAKMADVDVALSSSGTVTLDTPTPKVDAQVKWTALQWPLQGTPQILSDTGRLSVTGWTDRYQLSLDARFRNEQQLSGTLTAQASGNPEQVDISDLRIKALRGQVTGRARVSIQPEVSFTTELEGSGINPQDLFSDWPGQLNFKLAGSGHSLTSAPNVALSSVTVNGQLRDQPVIVNARGTLSPEQISVEKFDLASGTTTMSVSGLVQQTLALDWSIQSPDLNAIAPFLHGKLHGQGALSGTRQAPQLKLEMQGENVKYRNSSVSKLHIDADYTADNADSSVINASAVEVALGDYQIDEIDVLTRGLVAQHTINLSIKSEQGSLEAMINGELQNSKDYLFALKQTELTTSELGLWSLVTPGQGKYSGQSFSLSQTCLGQKVSTLCAEATVEAGTTQMQLAMQDVPVGLLAAITPLNPKVTGTLDGRGNFKLTRAGLATAELEFLTSAMEVTSRAQSKTNTQALRFDPSSLSLNILPSGIARLNANFPMQDIGGITATASIEPNHDVLTKRSLSGELNLNIPSLSFLASHIPEVTSLEGAVASIIDLSGTLEQPRVLGSLQMTGGRADLASLGIELNELKFTALGQPDNTIKLDASAVSGNGQVSVSGDVMLGENPRSELTLTGEKFLLVNTPEATVRVSPDVTMIYQNSAIEIEGDVVVPTAKLNLDNLPKSAVRVSKDQILIDSDEQSTQMSTPLTASLNVTLGDDVHFDGFGLEAQLEGRLKIKEVPGKPATGTGEVDLIDGEYEAYGQRLKISNGTLLFVGGPLEQPGIDIRAVRNPTPDIEVGVTARGSLLQPEFSIFSTPSMSESEQLAYLIFGRPLNVESAGESSMISNAALAIGLRGGDKIGRQLAGGLGLDQLNIESGGSEDLNEAALVIGKYLSPRLFVSYGIGILEPVSTVKLEYILSSKWRLITESSSLQSGADAQYAIER